VGLALVNGAQDACLFLHKVKDILQVLEWSLAATGPDGQPGERFGQIEEWHWLKGMNAENELQNC